MRPSSAAIISLLTAVPLVAGHGYVAYISVDGKKYPGNTPGGSSVLSPIRAINAVDPVKGTANPEISCGHGAQNAAELADANLGSTVSFKWVNGFGGDQWPHFVGPLMTYMASCGPGSCLDFDSSSAKWFKIQESGLRADGTWAMKDLYDGLPANVSLPQNIAPGEYLIRHEILALHTAQSIGGAEFYPSCAQVKVGGARTGVPNSTVPFPGAYSDTDPGILIDPYDMTGDYPFPGPPVSQLVDGPPAMRVAIVDDAAAIDSPYEHVRVGMRLL
ncbi:glycoside hydrolase [Ganoderma leucocontextum]|nr:glycoside hydrolase [Ganoderma leucocontextum]